MFLPSQLPDELLAAGQTAELPWCDSSNHSASCNNVTAGPTSNDKLRVLVVPPLDSSKRMLPPAAPPGPAPYPPFKHDIDVDGPRSLFLAGPTTLPAAQPLDTTWRVYEDAAVVQVRPPYRLAMKTHVPVS